MNVDLSVVEEWLTGNKHPPSMHPNQAEQWRQSALFKMAKPLDRLRGKIKDSYHIREGSL